MTVATADPFRFTTIAHSDHRYASPLGEGKAATLLEVIARSEAVARDDKAIDVGCGKAAFLIDAVRRLGLRGVGVDPNPAFIDAAKKAASAAGVAERITFHQSTVADLPLGRHEFAFVACIGATHAFGGYRAGLHSLAGLVRPGGLLLVGEGYWRKQPDPS